MFKIIARDKTRFHIQSSKESRIIPVDLFDRAQGRKDRESEIRKPVFVLINHEQFIFTRKEWKKFQRLPDECQPFTAEISKQYKMGREDAIQNG